LFQIVGSFQTFTFHKVMYRQGVMRPLMISSLHDLCRVRRWKKNWKSVNICRSYGQL